PRCMRHRLPLEPHGFEGVVAGHELCGGNPSIEHGPEARSEQPYLGVGARGATVVTTQDKHALIVHLDHVSDFGAVALPRLQPVEPYRPQTVWTRQELGFCVESSPDASLEILMH